MTTLRDTLIQAIDEILEQLPDAELMTVNNTTDYLLDLRTLVEESE